MQSLEQIEKAVRECRQCNLCIGRKNAVPGEGNPKARLMFIGEGPGADEDKQGRPFVGRAGKLLDKMIEAMGLTRDLVYIANVVKCRPPGNRAPRPGEAHTCMTYLTAQIANIKPDVICCLGKTAAYWMLQGPETRGPLRELRGKWHGPVRVTYHPAYLLRNPAAKAEAWQDLQAIMERLDKAWRE